MSEVADGPEISVSGARRSPHRRLHPLECLAHRGTHELGRDDADVQVGHQRQRADALTGPAVQHDGAGLRDGGGAAGEHAVHPIERRDRRITRRLHPGRQPALRQIPRHGQAAGTVRRADLGDQRGHAGPTDAVHGARGTRPPALRTARPGRPAPAASPAALRRLTAAAGRPGPRGCGPARPHGRRSCHHSRKLCGATAGRSRPAVQALIGPAPATRAGSTRASRCARR